MDEPVGIDALKVHVRQHRHELGPGCAPRPARAASRSTRSRGSRKAIHIAGLVRELYTSLTRPPEAVRIRLRAAPTFKPEASRLLGDLLQDMQHKLTTRGHGPVGR